jgi:hypothetical protein
MQGLPPSLARNAARHGWRNALEALALKTLDECCGVRVLRAFCFERPDPGFLRCPEPLKAGFLTSNQARRYSRDPEAKFSEKFLNAALARGDRCFAIRDGEVLAAYAWYSTRITPIDVPQLGVSFSKDYVYMYKAFTCPDYRGRRLHAMVKSQALGRYRALGYRGIVSYVEASNLNSLKSVFRMGCEDFGSVYVVRRQDGAFALASPGCERFRFRLDRVESPFGSFSLGEH